MIKDHSIRDSNSHDLREDIKDDITMSDQALSHESTRRERLDYSKRPPLPMNRKLWGSTSASVIRPLTRKVQPPEWSVEYELEPSLRTTLQTVESRSLN